MNQDTRTAAEHIRESFLVFGAPRIEQAEIEEVVDSLTSGWLGTGPKVARFERAFAAYKGVRHVAALNSCTAALHVSILAAGLQPGDEIITTPLTFCATINAIVHAGAVPVLADVDPQTMNIDPNEIERRLTPRTRAILPVHFAGRPCDMDAIGDIARRQNLTLIEDCAHAVEAEYRGRKTGTFGDFGCFSFYATKNVVTGEGGMVITRRKEDAARVSMLGLHGLSRDAWQRFSADGYRHYEVVACGFKYNMTDLQAALGIHQLARVEDNWARRAEIWRAYNEGLCGLPIHLPPAADAHTRHGYHLYTILIDPLQCNTSRDAFLNAMTARGIGVGVHYLSVPEHSYYQRAMGWKPEQYPNAMRIGRQTVSLPLSARLTDDDVADVVHAATNTLAGLSGTNHSAPLQLCTEVDTASLSVPIDGAQS